MNRVKHIVLLWLCCLFGIGGIAQIKIPAGLEPALEGKTNFYDIKKTVENYYTQMPDSVAGLKSNQRQLKFWNRWFYESESRLMPDGTVGDAAKIKFDLVNELNSTSSAQTAFGEWLFKGPTGVDVGIGRVNRVAFHPTNPNIVYAGTANGGLWKLTHIANQYSWTDLTPGLPTMGISGIVVSHVDPNTIYILTGDGDAVNNGSFTASWGYASYSVGVLKSTDGGANWFNTDSLRIPNNGRYAGFKLIQDPVNANILFAATTSGLFKTTDGGLSWNICVFNFGAGSRNYEKCFDVEIQPTNSSIVLASFNTYYPNDSSRRPELYRSIDGGSNFDRLFISGISTEDKPTRIELEFSKSNPSVVYALCGPGYITPNNTTNDSYKGLFKSTDAGLSWNIVNNTPDVLAYRDVLNDFENQSDYDLALAVSPTNSNRVLTGGLVVWRTENSGATMTEVIDYFSDIDNSNYIHPDVHDLAYNPLNNRLYAATDGGVAFSDDHGDNWNRLFFGIGISQFYHFEAENEDGYTWGGTQDNGVIKQYSGSTWDEFDGGDGYDVLTDKVGNNDDSYWIINNNIYADGPGSPSINVNITPQGKTEFFPLLEMHTNSEDILYAGYEDFLYVSNDRGDNWTTRQPAAKWAIGVCASNSPRLYVAGIGDTVNVLWRIENVTNQANHTLHQITTGLYLAGYPGNTANRRIPKITSISVNPQNSNQLWVTVSGYHANAKVFFSGDAGASFTNISAGLPNIPILSSITDGNGNTYIGTEIGVYYRNNSMTSWTPFFNGMPRVPVSDLDFKTIVGVGTKYLYAATYGRGIWYTEVYADCSSSINITAAITGHRFYQASQTITSTSNIQGGAGTEVAMRSGNNVTLTPGFSVKAGSTYSGFIGPCNTGIPLMTKTTPDTAKKSAIDKKVYVPPAARIMEIVDQQASIVCEIPGRYQLLMARYDDTNIRAVEIDLVKGNNKIELNEITDIKGQILVQLVKENTLLNMQEMFVK